MANEGQKRGTRQSDREDKDGMGEGELTDTVKGAKWTR